MSDIENYIRQAARARGIDPDIAVRVARSEGGLKDPTRQSLVTKGGRQEPSYGPFQLLIGGGNTGFPGGMGNDALRAGIDPRTPEGAYKGIDFALDRAKSNGWGAWYGAKAQGITGMQGIGGSPSGVSPTPPTRSLNLTSNPISSPISGGVDVAPPITDVRTVKDSPVFGVPDVAAPVDVAAAPSAPAGTGMLDQLKTFGATPGVGNGLGAIAKAFGGGQQSAQAQEHATPIQSILPSMEASDSARMASAQQLMAQLIQARRSKAGGLNLMS